MLCVKRLVITFVAVLLPLAASCATVQPTGWLQDYHRLYHVGGVPLEQVWIEPEFNVQAYRTLYIAPVQIDPLAYRDKGEADHEKAQRLAAALRRAVYNELKNAGIFEIVSVDPYFTTVHDQALTLQLRITEINSGNPKLRQIIGFGAGATNIQIEGKLFEQKTCRTFIEFADRRMHPGGALMLGMKLASDGEFLMGIDAKGIMRGIVKLFVFLREEGPPNDQR